MRRFQPDKEYLVTFTLDGLLQSQQLNCWATDPDLTTEAARRRLVYQRGWGDESFDRIKVQEIIVL